jgi:hypothetical protein
LNAYYIKMIREEGFNMKKLVLSIAVGMVLTFGAGFALAGIDYSSTAGDQDYAATRNAYDVTTNMDFYVFNPDTSVSGAATNNKGEIKWSYVLPFSVVAANSGSMTVRAWDIDTSDQVEVYFKFGSTTVYAGLVTGSNGGNVTTWENAVANGTTASLDGWSTTTFNFSPALLAALSGSTGFELYLQVIQEATEWATVIDYATINLNYEPGEPNPNPTPEPTTMLLLGLGVLGLAGLRKRD